MPPAFGLQDPERLSMRSGYSRVGNRKGRNQRLRKGSAGVLRRIEDRSESIRVVLQESTKPVTPCELRGCDRGVGEMKTAGCLCCIAAAATKKSGCKTQLEKQIRGDEDNSRGENESNRRCRSRAGEI